VAGLGGRAAGNGGDVIAGVVAHGYERLYPFRVTDAIPRTTKCPGAPALRAAGTGAQAVGQARWGTFEIASW
jgi:hypothetical protein